MKNKNKPRYIPLRNHKESNKREYVLDINKPTNKNKDKLEKPCAKEIIKLHNKPLAFKDNKEVKQICKCKILENAINFLKSMKRKEEQIDNKIPTNNNNNNKELK